MGEGLNKLHLLVEMGIGAELVANTVEGVAAVAREVIDAFEQFDVLVIVEAGAFLILIGLDLGKFGLPKAEQRGVDPKHLGNFANGIIEFVGHR